MNVLTEPNTESNVPNKEDAKEDAKEDSKEAKEAKEQFIDPSVKKANDLQKFSTDPIKIPGTELLEVEPKAALAASNIAGIFVDKLSDPNFTKSIVENIEKSIELSFETKKNKLEHLKKDTDLVKESQTGGNSFFTEEECSFF